MLQVYRDHGFLAVTVNFQGRSPFGYSRIDEQVWLNSAFITAGDLRADYLARIAQVIERAEGLGMVIILGYFYFGQESRLVGETKIRRAVDNATDWLLDQGYTNVLVEVNNECNVFYQQPILRPERVHDLIEQVKSKQRGGRRLLGGTSYGGNHIPGSNVFKVSDFILLHENSVEDPQRIIEMVQQTRAVKRYRPMPVIFYEDDHFIFERPLNNFAAAISQYASWVFFRLPDADEGFDEGFQCVPVNWAISSDPKRGFFQLAADISGYALRR